MACAKTGKSVGLKGKNLNLKNVENRKSVFKNMTSAKKRKK